MQFFILFTKNGQYWYGAVVRRNFGIVFLYKGVTLADFRDSGNQPCRKNKFIT